MMFSTAISSSCSVTFLLRSRASSMSVELVAAPDTTSVRTCPRLIPKYRNAISSSTAGRGPKPPAARSDHVVEEQSDVPGAARLAGGRVEHDVERLVGVGRVTGQ